MKPCQLTISPSPSMEKLLTLEKPNFSRCKTKPVRALKLLRTTNKNH